MPPSSNPNHREPYENLLAAAATAHEHGQYKEAVILAQTSVELFTEKVLQHLYVSRDIVYLKGPFDRLLINYNIANSKVSELYMALSKDPINQAPFWSKFTAHAELRNDLVHEGKDASQAQAAASLAAVSALIEHVYSKL